MPEFRLRMWAEQVLFDCEDYVVTAETLEDAVAQLQDLSEKADGFADGSCDLPNNIDNVSAFSGAFRSLDPQEIVGGASGVTLVDETGRRVRDLESVPTGCVQLGEPLE